MSQADSDSGKLKGKGKGEIPLYSLPNHFLSAIKEAYPVSKKLET